MKIKKNQKTKVKKKSTIKPRAKPSTKTKSTRFRASKTENFLENIRTNNSMIEYITKLRIMNPAATLQSSPGDPRREGGFVRLAHARDEFEAPKLSKGKSVSSARRSKRK